MGESYYTSTELFECDQPISEVNIDRYISSSNRDNKLQGYAIGIFPGGPSDCGYSRNLHEKVFLAITELGRRGSTRSLVLKLNGNFSKGELEIISGVFRLYAIATKRPFNQKFDKSIKEVTKSEQRPTTLLM